MATPIKCPCGELTGSLTLTDRPEHREPILIMTCTCGATRYYKCIEIQLLAPPANPERTN